METVNNQRHPLLLKRSQAQQLLGVGPSKYKQLVCAGRLREIAIGVRGRRLPYAEAERYIEESLSKTDSGE